MVRNYADTAPALTILHWLVVTDGYVSALCEWVISSLFFLLSFNRKN